MTINIEKEGRRRRTEARKYVRTRTTPNEKYVELGSTHGTDGINAIVRAYTYYTANEK